jgi:hypothetical protein
MFDRDDPLAPRHQREKWRRNWINKFAARQRVARRWIEFVEIAKWCARSTTAKSIDDEQRALEVAYQRLANSILAGEFEANGRSTILYLEARVLSIGTFPHRLTRDWFERGWKAAVQFGENFQVAGMETASSAPIHLLAHCWVTREIAQRWLEAHHYPLPPFVAPSHGDPSKMGVVNPGATAGRRGRKPGSGEIDDEDNIKKILRLLATGAAPSVYAAARQVVRELPGMQSIDSAQRRLSRKFCKRFGTDPPPERSWVDVERELNSN